MRRPYTLASYAQAPYNSPSFFAQAATLPAPSFNLKKNHG